MFQNSVRTLFKNVLPDEIRSPAAHLIRMMLGDASIKLEVALMQILWSNPSNTNETKLSKPISKNLQCY